MRLHDLLGPPIMSEDTKVRQKGATSIMNDITTIGYTTRVAKFLRFNRSNPPSLNSSLAYISNSIQHSVSL